MGDYEQTSTVRSPADELFAYLSEPDNLPSYFHAITEAHQGDPGEVHVRADVEGRTVESDAWFKVDRDARTLSWGSEGRSNYHGNLSVAALDDATSELTIALHTQRVEAPQLQDGLRETLEQIQSQVEHGDAPASD